MDLLYDSMGRVATQQFYTASNVLAKRVCTKYDGQGRQNANRGVAGDGAGQSAV